MEIIPLLHPVMDDILKRCWDLRKWNDVYTVPLTEAAKAKSIETGVVHTAIIPPEIQAQNDAMTAAIAARLGEYAADPKLFPFLMTWRIEVTSGKPGTAPPKDVVQKAMRTVEGFQDEFMRRGESIAVSVLEELRRFGNLRMNQSFSQEWWQISLISTDPLATAITASLRDRFKSALACEIITLRRVTNGYTVPGMDDPVATRMWLTKRGIPL